MRLAFIGLGVMGYPMAGHLASAGHDVTVFNRSRPKAQRWCDEFPGFLASTPAAAAAAAELVFACVGDDPDIREVCLAEQGAFAGMATGSVFVDHTTCSADVSRALAAQASARGLAFLDAPVSGGQQGAENGVLTVMIGGDPAAFERARPVIEIYARAVTHMGPSGAGQLTKMVNQICAAGILQGLSEGLHLAGRSGLDVAKVLAVISKGAAQSWQMENRGTTMMRDEFDFGFAVDWMRKDLRICLEQARACDANLPVTALVDQFYAQIQAMGGGRWDTSSLIRLLKRD